MDVRRISISIVTLLALGCGSAPCPPAETAQRTQAAPADPAAEGLGPEAPAVAPGTLVLDGTPEIPPELSARLQQYLETRSASAQSISSDGSSLLVTTRFADTAQLHHVGGPLAARQQLTFGEEPVRAARFYPGDDDAVLVMADVGGTENYQLYRFDRGTGRSTLLTDGEHRHPDFLFSRDGARLAYTSNARNGRDLDVWLGDGRTPGQLFLERSGDWHLLDFSRDGSKLLLLEYVSITDSRIHVVDLASHEVRRISPEGTRAADRAAIFDATGQRAYVTSDRGSEFVTLYEVDLARPEQAWRPLTSDIPWNVEHVELASDGRTLALVTNEDGISVLRTMDTRTRRATIVEGAPRGVIASVTAARDAPVFALSIGTASAPLDAYVFDARRRRLERWTQSEVGGLDPSNFVTPELVHYRSFDEREIPAFYYRPRAASGDATTKAPVVVYIHGGPESQARPWFTPLIQYLASESGVAVLVPNVRGSDGYGKTYLALDDGRNREDSVRDIGAALDWIGQQAELDPERVAVFGGSYGGYMVLASLVHFGERLRAGVDIVGIANFVTFLENTADYRRHLRRAEYGDESDAEMRTFLAQISPVTNVERIRSALFVAHGANDPRVPADEAEQIVRAVRASGHDVWYMLARNEGHGFVRKENRDVFTELSVMFLEQHLEVRR